MIWWNGELSYNHSRLFVKSFHYSLHCPCTLIHFVLNVNVHVHFCDLSPFSPSLFKGVSYKKEWKREGKAEIKRGTGNEKCTVRQEMGQAGNKWIKFIFQRWRTGHGGPLTFCLSSFIKNQSSNTSLVKGNTMTKSVLSQNFDFLCSKNKWHF